jgi:hypothetical protein
MIRNSLAALTFSLLLLSANATAQSSPPKPAPTPNPSPNPFPPSDSSKPRLPVYDKIIVSDKNPFNEPCRKEDGCTIPHVTYKRI